MYVYEIADVSVALSSTPAATAGFSVPLLLVDTADVPIDVRYIITTKGTYATDLTAASDADEWATILWGQNYNVSQAYIGRWVSANSNPLFICGNAVTTLATWTAIADGCCTVTTTAGADILAALDFTLVTSMADVCTVIQTDLTAGGLSGATVALDALNRVVFTDPAVTGAGADTVIISASGAGTGIELPAYLNVAGGWAQGGLDAEDLDDALAAILALDNTPFAIHQRGGSIAQVVDLATACIANKKIAELVITDADAKSAVATTDVPYQLSQLSNNNAHGCYTEHTTQSPDAAVGGEIYPQPEGSTSWSNNPLASVYQSGLGLDGTSVIALTPTEISALEGKSCDFLIRPSTLTHLRNGLTFGGVEVRLRQAYYWLEYSVSVDIYAFLLGQKVTTFSDPDIQAIGGILNKYLQVLVQRKVIEDDYTITLPSAADFSAAVKATHTLTLTEITELVSQIAVNDVVMTMSASV